MALSRFVVTATVTIAAGTPVTPTAGEQVFGSSSLATGSGSSSTWPPMEPYTFHPGDVIYADSSAPGSTPTGTQQLYQAIGSSSLRAYVDGQDGRGGAALAN